MTTWHHEQRLAAVKSAVRQSRAKSVLDLGCGNGDLLTRLVAEPRIRRIVGVDLSLEALLQLRRRLSALPGPIVPEVELLHASMTDNAATLTGFDCAVLVETIEHINPERLSVLERSLFGTMQPATVVITTPNSDFNPLLGVPSHQFRHWDHRFEWGRSRFRRWAQGVAVRNGYRAVCSDVAGAHPILGGASQMAVFHQASPVDIEVAA